MPAATNLWTLDPHQVVEDLIVFDLENGTHGGEDRWHAGILNCDGTAVGFELGIPARGVAIEGRADLHGDAWDLRIYSVPMGASISTARFALDLLRADPDTPYRQHRLTRTEERLPARLSAVAVDAQSRQQFPSLFTAAPGLSCIDVFSSDENREFVELRGLWCGYRFHLFVDRFNGAELMICTDDVPPFQSLWRSRAAPGELIDRVATSGRFLSDGDLHALFAELAQEIQPTQFEYVFMPVGASEWDEVTLSHWWPATAASPAEAYALACADLEQFLSQHPQEPRFTLNPVPVALDTRRFPAVAPAFTVAGRATGEC